MKDDKAILEISVPESCFACLLCLPSDTRSGLFCRAADFITDDYHSSRHPNCLLKIVEGKTCQRCGNITVVRFHGLCHECNKHIENYDCKKELNHE